MRDPENPHELLPAIAEPLPEPKARLGQRALLDKELAFLWYLKNSNSVIEKYGIKRDKGKFIVFDKALLEQRCSRELGLKETLRKLWTENKKNEIGTD